MSSRSSHQWATQCLTRRVRVVTSNETGTLVRVARYFLTSVGPRIFLGVVPGTTPHVSAALPVPVRVPLAHCRDEILVPDGTPRVDSSPCPPTSPDG